jgi:Putative MetA-pathway of phenol degradation
MQLRNIFFDFYLNYKMRVLIILLLIVHVSKAQTTKDIETDRPDQTETPYTVGKNKFQVEAGFSKTNIDKILFQNTLVSLLRFGLSEKFEWRAEIIRDSYTAYNKKVTAGLQPIEIGFKTNLLEENGLTPKTSLIAHIVIPKAATNDFKGQYFSPNFRFTMQHSIGEKQSLSYNIGGEWGADDGKFTPLYTLATGYDFSKKIYGYIEFFGFFTGKNIDEHSFDGGLAYLLKPNVQLDISAGFGISKFAPQNYWAIGLSFRMPK